MESSKPAGSAGPEPSAPPIVWAHGPVVGLLLLLTVFAAWQTRHLIATLQQTRFDNEVRRIDSAIEQRMVAYIQVLRGGLGLFQSSDEVTREEWAHFVDTLKLGEHYPGFKNFTFAAAVRAEDLSAFLAKVRAEPLPEGLVDADAIRQFKLSFGGKPAQPRPLHAPILYVAPFTADNQLALGLDLMQEPMRRSLLEQTAASGEAVLSPRIKLMQRVDPVEGRQAEAGFVAFLAVQKQARLIGWLTAACRAEEFMRGLLGSSDSALAFEVFDGPEPLPESLLYSTQGVDAQRGPLPLPADAGSTLERVSRVDMPGRQWAVRYRAPPAFFPLSERVTPWLVLIGGVLATLLFSAIARAGVRWRLQVEALKVAESAVRHQATHDPLTGLANRVLFVDRLQIGLERARRGQQRLALIYIDIDGFKPVNDTHGHYVGDLLLRYIARRLEQRLRSEDTAARLGGDEFALILENAVKPPEETQRICDELVAVLREPYAIRANGTSLNIFVGASLGIAHFPDCGSDADALIAAADAAMYQAKRAGRNRAVQAPAMV